MTAARHLPVIDPERADEDEDERRGRLLYQVRYGAAPLARPVTRGDCSSVPRPCPFAAECRYGLLGAKLTAPSCALDEADRVEGEGMLLEDVAAALGLSVAQVRDIETEAATKVARRWVAATPPSLRDDGRPGW